jgi:integrase
VEARVPGPLLRPLPVGEISPQLVDRFRDELHEQAETIRRAQERARTEKGWRPLMESVTDKLGRTYERRRRPLSNTSINAMITLLGQFLQQAVDYEVIDRNPVRVGGRSARFLKRSRPKRTFLEVDEFHSLLDAAGELEAGARRDFQGLGRRAMVAVLGLAGLRISELMDLRVAQWISPGDGSSWPTRRPRRAYARSRSRSTSATSYSSTR